MATNTSGSRSITPLLALTRLTLDTLGGAFQVKPWSNLANNITVIVVSSVIPGQPCLPVSNDINLKWFCQNYIRSISTLKVAFWLELEGFIIPHFWVSPKTTYA